MTGLLFDDGPWQAVKDGDPVALALYERHYSARQYRDGRRRMFRNEGHVLSSELIGAAMGVAWRRWPGERLYTYVDAAKVASSNPGYCFLMAGWRRCGVTKGGHGRAVQIILEALSAWFREVAV